MTNNERECDCKVGTVIGRRGLGDLDDELVARRRGADGHPASLRTLADHVNQAVLRDALDGAGTPVLDGEVENLYRLLTDDEVSRGTRARARKRLEHGAVDLAAVEADFVSHPTVGRHLEECLGVERPGRSRDPVESAKERLFKLHSRTEAVVENTLDGLASADRLSAGDLVVTVDVQVTCQTCGAHDTAGVFIDRGGCDCDAST